MLKEREEIYAIQWNILTHEAECLKYEEARGNKGTCKKARKKEPQKAKIQNLRMLANKKTVHKACKQTARNQANKKATKQGS